MVDYDYNALVDANKVLSICFIVAITIANCLLIYRKFRIGSLLYTPRSLILTSLAIGDIFLALFVLVFFVTILFVSFDFTLYCSTYKAFVTYRNFLPHFVYGVGLVVLAGEFLQRHRTPQPTGNTSSSLAKSIVYSACPWILGLIIILPLTMANAYEPLYRSHDCVLNVTKSRSNAMYVVSVILPAILAVLACIAVALFVKLSPAYQLSSPAAATYQGPPHGAIITSQNPNVGNAATSPQYPWSNAAAAPYYSNTSIQGPQLYLSNGQSETSHYPVQQNPEQQYPGQQYPPTQYAVQYPPPQLPAQQYTTQSNVIVTAPTNVIYQQNTAAPPNPDKERKALLVAAIIFFLCVVPHASYEIHSKHFYSLVTENSLFWLSVARSLITPFIFIIFS